jgi:hypothetical protein
MANVKTLRIVGGGVWCVVPLVALVFGLGAIGCTGPRDEESGAATNEAAVEAVEESEGEAADVESRTWTNDRSRLSGDKLTNFVPFTFEYPADWQILEDGTGDSPNFVKVESMTADQVTIENFAVGWYAGVSADQVAQILEPQFSQAFPNYRRLAEESHHVDEIPSPGFTFEVVADIPQGPTTFWGRTIAVPVAEDRGIILVMFASDQAAGVDSAADVGAAGNLDAILDSFDVQE